MDPHTKNVVFSDFENLFDKKIINMLKAFTSFRTPKFLADQNFIIINDLAFFFGIWKQNDKNSILNIRLKD